MTFGEKLKQIRLEKSMSQQDFADLLNTSKQVISRYELGQTTPKIGVAAKWCLILGINLDNMLNDEKGIYDKSAVYSNSIPENIIPLPETRTIPLLGDIACGEPILAEQNIESYIPVPDEIRCDFCLRCKGDSMVEAGIHNGDIVYIRRQDDVDDGSIAAVIICGTDTEATLKRVYHNDDHITLMPANPAYSPILVTGETLSNLRILGVAVAVTSKLPGR